MGLAEQGDRGRPRPLIFKSHTHVVGDIHLSHMPAGEKRDRRDLVERTSSPIEVTVDARPMPIRYFQQLLSNKDRW